MAKPIIIPNAVDGYSYPVTTPQEICVQVVSGTPVMSFSQDEWLTETTLDLTASSTYPNAVVTLPECHYKFTLSGAEVKVSTLKKSL